MWSVSLERRPAREELRGFGVAAGLSAAILGAATAALLGSTAVTILAVGLVLFAGVSAAAWKRPDRFEGAYRGWNRLARAYARRARKAVLGICFFTVVAAVGLTGGALEIRSSGDDGSRWRGRITLPPDQYAGQGRGQSSRRGSRNGDFRSWAARSGHGWMLFLIPFLMLIEAFDVRDSVSTPDGIYTLY